MQNFTADITMQNKIHVNESIKHKSTHTHLRSISVNWLRNIFVHNQFASKIIPKLFITMNISNDNFLGSISDATCWFMKDLMGNKCLESLIRRNHSRMLHNVFEIQILYGMGHGLNSFFYSISFIFFNVCRKDNCRKYICSEKFHFFL